MQLSFDEAANREYVNTLMEDGTRRPTNDQDEIDGDKTPVGSLEDAEMD